VQALVLISNEMISWITEILTQVANILRRADILRKTDILRRADHSDTAMQREQLRNGRVEKQELFAFLAASSLLGSL